MIDGRFEEELGKLNKMLLEMGEEVGGVIAKSWKVYQIRDLAQAKKIVADDRIIDLKELAINEEYLRLLALYQPVASDLRFITTAASIVTDLERMADIAVDIAYEILEMKKDVFTQEIPELSEMVEMVKTMLTKSLSAFVKRDTVLAKEVLIIEDKVDLYRNQICQKIESVMIRERREVGCGLRLTIITRYFERMADHITNIAEDIVYMVDAQVIKHQPAPS